MSLIDAVSLVKELRELILDIRLQNVYSINSKTYLLKFYDSATKKKISVVVEKGTKRARTSSTHTHTHTIKNRDKNACDKV